MESGTSTGQFEPTVEAPAPEATAEARPALVTSLREQCSTCGAAMAPDQRYCLECGERRGAARVPLLEGPAQHAREASSPSRPPRRARMTANSTLLAGIGTLLLAMGVGVLIGRSGNGASAKAPPAQVVTVAGGGGTAGTATTSTAPTSSTAATGKSSGAAAASAAKASAKRAATPPPKVVKVGSKGSGPGYQHGHFTGNFFGEEGK